MAADTVGETCVDNYFTEETFDAAMVQQTQSNKDNDENNSDSSSEDNAEFIIAEKSKPTENGTSTDETPSKPLSDVSEEPMDVDILNNEIPKNDVSNRFTNDIDNIEIHDDPLDNEKDSNKDDDNIVNTDDNVDESDPIKVTNVSKNLSVENIILNEDGLLRSANSGKPTNVVVFSPKNNFGDKQLLNSDLFKGQKIFLLNGNVISKEEVEKTKTDNINIICVSNNLNDIIKNIKNDTIKPGRSLLINNDTDKSNTATKPAEKATTNQTTVPVKATNGPKFIQLTQNNFKSISPKINVNVTPCAPKAIAPKPVPPVKKSNDILRTKLLENSTTNQNPIEPVVMVKNRSLSAQKKDDEPESPAVAKARSEFIKCRKQLIEAAVHPQLPTYKPLSGYDGPLYACEECDDAFSCMDSLKNHKNRRSVLFTYACPLCKSTLEFFNRCTFLLHVRSHDAAVKACYLTISTIPADKLNFKLLEQEENDNQSPQSIQRSKDRVISRKESEESIESTSKEIKENGLDKPKSVLKPVDRNSLKGFDFIKSLRKSKFSTYLQNIEQRKKNIEKEIEHADSTSSEDSSLDDISNDRKTSEETSANEKPSKANGDSNSSQLKYYLTVNKSNTPNTKPSLKRPLENTQNEDEPKKNKIDIPIVPELEKEPHKPKPVSQPVIIKKPTTSKTETDKNSEEITLTSSEDEEEHTECDAEKPKENEKKVICRDCRTEVLNLNKHYRADNKPLKEYPCEQCKFFNPSACALAAHNRMHLKTQPYICPDCGFYFSTLDTFQTHIRQVCYYDYKTIRFQCPECSLLKPSVPQFTDHLKRCHTRDVFKCSLCITSSYSPKVVEIHMKRKHEGETGTVLEGYRCMLCPNILVSKKSIDTHINKHVFSLKHLRYVYICKLCKKYASGKINKFIQHLECCQDKKREIVTKKDKSPAKTSPAKAQRSKSNRRILKSPISKDVVEVEEKDPLSLEDGEADKLKAEFVPKAKICVMCRSADIDSKSSSLFCNACVRYVNAEDNASKPPLGNAEQKPDTGRPKRKFKCRLCQKFMDKDWPTITQHYEKDHHADFNVKGEAKRQTKEQESKKSESSTPVNIIKKRKLSMKDTSSSKVAKVAESSFAYKCVKCEIATNNKEEFRNHIISHKEANTKQCLECGECFIVNSSLYKHLVIKHHIRDLRHYLMDEGLFPKDTVTKTEKKVVENQCEVCFLKCDSKQNYDKHIRTHGMAFVAMQSRSKDEKNPRG